MKKDFTGFEGLQFIHGRQDCYSLLCDIYKDHLGIELYNYVRPNDWWVNNMNLYVENFQKEGFFVVNPDEKAKLYDVFLIAIPDVRAENTTPANHCAIYIGDGQIIHHRYGKLSQIKPYNGLLKNFTTHHIRHNSISSYNFNPPKELDLMDILLPHKKAVYDYHMRIIEEKKNEEGYEPS